MNYAELKLLVYEDVGLWRMIHAQQVVVDDTIAAMWERLGGNEPHRAAVDDVTWTVAHPLPCRLQEGGLLACPVKGDRAFDDGPGMYVLVDSVWSKMVD